MWKVKASNVACEMPAKNLTLQRHMNQRLCKKYAVCLLFTWETVVDKFKILGFCLAI